MRNWSFFICQLGFLLFSVKSIQAQQFLNLDFETLSAEGIERPWGWNVNQYLASTWAKCDSNEVWQGNYSLLVHSEDTTNSDTFEYAFFIEPAEISSQSLKLRGYAKTQYYQGKAELLFRAVGEVSDSFGTLLETSLGLEESKDWIEFEVPEFIIPSHSHSVFIIIRFSGSGKLWLDALKLFLSEEEITSIPVAPPFTQEQLSIIKASSLPVVSVKPELTVDLSPDLFGDLSFLKQQFNNAKIIALGESTHGTHEFFTLKHRLLQYAITELGARVFILEDNQRIVEQINQFVLGGDGSAESVMKGLFAVWNTEEMLALIRWIRKYNDKHPLDPVEFVGMDAQNPALALSQLEKFLVRKESPIAKSSAALFANIQANWRNSYFLDDSTKTYWYREAKSVMDQIAKEQASWLQQAENGADSLDIYWALQDARVIMQFAEIQNTNVFEGRDRSMAENIKWHIDLRPEVSKFIVWAHDSHVARGDASDPSENYFLGHSMGSYLSKWFGDDYVSFGLFTYQGTCRGTISYSDFTQVPFQIYPSPAGSLDAGLHQIATQQNVHSIFLNLRELRDQRLDWLRQKRPVRYVGYVSEDYGFGGRYSIPFQFDGVFFIDQTTATR